MKLYNMYMNKLGLLFLVFLLDYPITIITNNTFYSSLCMQMIIVLTCRSQ